VLTAFGNRTGTFTVGGRGTFDGTMTESFRALRIAGTFSAPEMYAWDVNWGPASGDLVIQNGYLDITNGVIGKPDGSFIRADGRFALGYPRKDAGEEMNARVVVKDWPLLDVKTAFEQQDWPVEGTIAHADLTLRGPYEGLFGSGELRITNGVAWDEPFDSAAGRLKFEGTGVFVEGMEIAKAKGWLRGSAQLFWSGRFSFNAEGDRIPVESLESFRVEGLPLTGMLRISQVVGSGTFEQPRYEVDASVADLYLRDEGIGHVTGRLVVTNEELTLTSLEVASPRLSVSGTGSIKLNEAYDSRLSFVITDASLEPYLKFVGAQEISPYTRITVHGSMQISGPLADTTRLNVGVTLSQADITLLDYTLENPADEPIVLSFADNVFQIGKMRLQNLPDPLRGIKEKDTSLVLSGGVNVGERTVDIRADGDASLAVMQLFFTDVSASGTAKVGARIQGSFDTFGILGDAHITNGTIRYYGLPHSLTSLNGPIHFARDAIDVSELTARVGDGEVDFDGRILLAEGYQPSEFDVTARGTSMRLRYPPGVRSVVNMDLGLTGPINGPLLAGTITVLQLNYSPRVEDQTAMIGIASGGAAAALGPLDPSAEPGGFPMRLDITIDMETLPIIEHQAGFIEASAHLRFTGTYDRPALTGQVDIERGEYSFAGNRYFVRRGTIDFTNTGRIQPVFDVQAETRARAAGQTFQVGIRLSGTFDRITPTLTSDPWLPDEEIVSLLLGGTPDLGRLEQRQLGSPQQAQERMLQNAAVVLLSSPISSRLGSAFTDALPLTSLQITPTLGGSDSLQQLSPSARITVGQRISNNVFLTYSVALNDAQSELILVEYDQSDRLSWVLSRNGDRTFALDFRIRYVF
jgi:translocation and assembly module TamB